MCVNYTKSVNQNSSTACSEREVRVIRKKDWIFNFWYDFRWAWASHCASLGFLLTKTRKSRRKIIPCTASILVSFNCQELTRNLNNWILNGVWKLKQANCELCNTATWAKKFDLLLECCQAPDLILNVCLFLQNAFSSNSYASLMFSKLPRAFIIRYTHAKHGPSLYYYMRLTHVEVLQYMKAVHIAQFFLSGIDRKSHFFVLQSSARSNWKALTKSAMTGAVESIFKVSDFVANGRYFLVLILIMLIFF